MLSADLDYLIHQWHTSNGGHGKKLYPHALRSLREMVELCLVAGASAKVIYETVDAELIQQASKATSSITTNALQEELADVVVTLSVFEYYAGVSTRVGVMKKLPILITREWQADEHGVLWRSERVPVPSDKSMPPGWPHNT